MFNVISRCRARQVNLSVYGCVGFKRLAFDTLSVLGLWFIILYDTVYTSMYLLRPMEYGNRIEIVAQLLTTSIHQRPCGCVELVRFVVYAEFIVELCAHRALLTYM